MLPVSLLPTILRDGLPLLSADQMRDVDRRMIEDYEILLVQMMENAGRNLANLAQMLLDGVVQDKVIVVLAGRGNNGGGGMVAARHLSNRGAQIMVWTVGDKTAYRDGVTRHQHQILEHLPVEMHVCDNVPTLPDADLIIDAIIGYGLRGEPRGSSKGMIEAATAHGAPILSLDVPSGLDAKTGEALTPVIEATATMTLALPKLGLLQEAVVGQLFLADISVPPNLYRSLGLGLPPLFADGPLVQVVSEEG